MVDDKLDVAGVNEQKMENLALDIIEYANRLNKIFNRIQLITDETKNSFISDQGDLFRKKLENQSNYYQIVNQNILSYANDIIKVNNKYKFGVKQIADSINVVESINERGE